ncbi:hypothetical protein MLD38_038072 [Melastoma candidum]|uniref:Uncharacterized protein n=1 Tax=Melastoma candidum TaxID=119954 RepID=A0ACB9KYR6_9MYRT|nr:hypothetical protein MLD38_038072 [Melastoma candidum]
MSAAAAVALSPGFRFHPSDEELILYYLKRKALEKRVPADVIVDIDIYKFEPWELAGQSKMDIGANEWYFYCKLDRKYSASERVKRSTAMGYWKLTGRPLAIKAGLNLIGFKRTLVFYYGRGPRSQRTNWIMYEYESHDNEGEPAASRKALGHYILCKVLHKISTGRPWEHQHGPFQQEQQNETTPGEPSQVNLEVFDHNQEGGMPITPGQNSNPLPLQKREGKGPMHIVSEGSGSCSNTVNTGKPLEEHMEFISGMQEELYKISLESEILKQQKSDAEWFVHNLESWIQHFTMENKLMKAKLGINQQ